MFSFVAINRSNLRRRWFYLSIFETTVAQQLLEKKWIVDSQIAISKTARNPEENAEQHMDTSKTPSKRKR